MVVRQEGGGGPVGGRGEPGQDPGQIRLGIDAKEPAGPHDRLDHRRAPAGFGIADEEPVARTDLGRADHPLDGVLVGAHVAEADLGVAGKMRPAVIRVRDRLAEPAGRQRRGRECQEAPLQMLQGRLRKAVPPVAAPQEAQENPMVATGGRA